MELYRISKREYAALDGWGGMFYAGRWHFVGNKVIYAAQSRSLAALEYLVHLNSASHLLNNFVITTINIPKTIVPQMFPESELQNNWTNFENIAVTQNLGTAFLKKGNNLLLKVPSAIVPNEFNYIINPQHPLMQKCKIASVVNFSFDARLVK